MEIETFEPKSYVQFVDTVMSSFFTSRHGAWVFRGHATTDYKLVPSIGRRGFAPEDINRKEESLLSLFKKGAMPYLVDRHMPQNDWEWLALGQHHAMPTRLLDWTRNPNVALFFAVVSQPSADGCIYALNAEKQIPASSVESKSPAQVTKPFKYNPRIVTLRLQAQDGLFVVFPHPAAILEDQFRPDWNLKRLLIRADLKDELKYSLNRMGVHKASLFPGLDGLSEYLDWFHTASPLESR